MTHAQHIADPYLKFIALNRILRGWIQYYRHANVKDIAHKLDWWIYRRVSHWLKHHHQVSLRHVLAQYEQQQERRRKNLAVRNGKGTTIFLYRMSDLPITSYRTRNYPNPYLEVVTTMTQIEGERTTPLEAQIWAGGSSNTEWNELRRQILQRDGYKCQNCGNADTLEVHHRQARHQGGTDDPANLVTLCETCHIQTDKHRVNFVRQSK